MLIAVVVAVDVSSRPIENLHTITDCVCSNDVVTYECTICGGFATVWEGSAFDCPSQEITLPNNNFGTPQAVGVCNNGRIVARGLSMENGCYTSQLNVTFDAGLQFRAVICSADNGTHTREVGHDVLHASTGSYAGIHLIIQK